MFGGICGIDFNIMTAIEIIGDFYHNEIASASRCWPLLDGNRDDIIILIPKKLLTQYIVDCTEYMAFSAPALTGYKDNVTANTSDSLCRYKGIELRVHDKNTIEAVRLLTKKELS